MTLKTHWFKGHVQLVVTKS